MSADLRLGQKLRLPLDAVTRTTAIVGQRGTGKTSTAVVVVEEALAAGAQTAVIDPTGAWYGLRSSADGHKAGLEVVVFGGHHGDVPLEPGAGAFLARLVIDEAISVVLDLELMSKAKQVQFVAEFAEELYHRNRRALTLVVDEAHRFAPQQLRDPGGYGARCLGAVTDVVTLGRRKGLGAVLISQRPAKINKDVFEQAEIMIAHRLMGPNDRKAIAGWLDEALGNIDVPLGSLASLDRGEAIVWAPDLDVMGRFAIRAKRTFDSSATPEIGATVAEPKGRADVDLAAIEQAMADTIERAKADDPAVLRKRIRDLETQLREHAAAEPERVEVEVPVPYVPDEIRKTLAKLRDALVDVKGYADELVIDVNEATPLEQPTPIPATPSVPPRRPAPTPKVGLPEISGSRAQTNGQVSGSQQRILDALASLEAIGQGAPVKTQVALFAKASPKSSGYTNNLGALRSSGAIDYPQPGHVALTDHGRELAVAQPGLATDGELHAFVRQLVGESKWRILDALIGEYPHALSKQDLAAAAGASPTSSGYTNNLGSLRSLGLIDYPEPGMVAALPVLFPGGQA
jgi:hypothetical protein